MEAVCVLMNLKPDRKPDAGGKMIEDYWPTSLKLLGDFHFLDTLKAYDKDNISPPLIKKIREKYSSNPEFVPELIKNASTAAEGLCKWVRAMETYDRVAKIVAPKKASLKIAEEKLSVQMVKLNEKRAELRKILDKLADLNSEFDASKQKKGELEDNIEMCTEKLKRAEKLITGE